MSQLALSMHNYESAHGQLPPAAVCGADGRPLLSWRVLLLPYIEQQGLYAQFHLDEPWDGPHNVKLLERMPEMYAPPRGKRRLVPPGHTVCKVFVGKGTAFEPGVKVTIAGIEDGSSNTILNMEAGPPVPWTKPEEFAFDPGGPLPAMEPLFKGMVRVGLADGSRRDIGVGVSEATLRAAITRNGGDKLGPDW